MDKRIIKILICCVACVLIVMFLSILAYRFSHPSCELIQIEPQNLRVSQLRAFNDAKLINSDDKSLSMKFFAYFEYNKLKHDSDDDEKDRGREKEKDVKEEKIPLTAVPNATNSTSWPNFAGDLKPAQPIVQPQIFVHNATGPAQGRVGPQASIPTGLINTNLSTSASILESHKQGKKRFLPLELESIEKRHVNDAQTKYKYVLTFNCTKMNVVLVHYQDRVFFESIKLELKGVGSKKKRECEVQLPASGAFLVNIGFNTNLTANPPLDHNSGGQRQVLKFYRDEPLRYSCYHGASPNGPVRSPPISNLSGDLHISAIEFEFKPQLANKADRSRNMRDQ